MEIFFAWLILSFVVADISSSRKIGFWSALLLSILLSPLIGILVVLTSKSLSTERFEKQLLDRLDGLNNTGSSKSFDKANELAALERKYQQGTITKYDFEFLKDNINQRYR